jgi:hypothetical protein
MRALKKPYNAFYALGLGVAGGSSKNRSDFFKLRTAPDA